MISNSTFFLSFFLETVHQATSITLDFNFFTLSFKQVRKCKHKTVMRHLLHIWLDN